MTRIKTQIYAERIRTPPKNSIGIVDTPDIIIIIKIHVRRAAAEDILKFTCICVCVCIYVFIYVFIYLFVSRLLATLTTIQT